MRAQAINGDLVDVVKRRHCASVIAYRHPVIPVGMFEPDNKNDWAVVGHVPPEQRETLLYVADHTLGYDAGLGDPTTITYHLVLWDGRPVWLNGQDVELVPLWTTFG